MKGLICIFSTTGNTRLACEYLVSQLEGISFDYLDIAKDTLSDLNGYDIVGFAAFADFLAPSKLMLDFIRNIPQQTDKYAFVFSTYGNVNGGTLKLLKKEAERRGFRVIGGFALAAPENYPPLIAGGMANIHNPKPERLEAFHQFIADLNQKIGKMILGEKISAEKLKIGFPDCLIPHVPRTMGRKSMGEKIADPELCSECGICKEKCPYGAISLEPKPRFDQGKCYGCWSCYNHCPTMAIYTKKLKKKGHYPNPPPQYAEKLKKD